MMSQIGFQHTLPCRIMAWVLSICLVITSLTWPSDAKSEIVRLPQPGTMIGLTKPYEPAMIKGLTIHPENPFLFDFIMDVGQTFNEADARQGLNQANIKAEGERLIKYFLAGLAIPDKDIWVNLSPYEKNRIIPEALSKTAMGRDLLAQDYILKQLSASLIYPEKALGKKFWDTLYAKIQQQYGDVAVPVNTFNKVWIVADKAEVYEHNQTAFVVGAHLKVMMEEDYVAMQKNSHRQPSNQIGNKPNDTTKQIIKTLILPEIEKEINLGKHFAQLRQIYQSIILANWFKQNLKQALLTQAYANRSGIDGISEKNRKQSNTTVTTQHLASKHIQTSNTSNTTKAPQGNPVSMSSQQLTSDEIYARYLKAYQKGVFNYIKEEDIKGQTLPRKYFSGGILNLAMPVSKVSDPSRAAEALASSHAMVSLTTAFKSAVQQMVSNPKITFALAGAEGVLLAAIVDLMQNGSNQVDFTILGVVAGIQVVYLMTKTWNIWNKARKAEIERLEVAFKQKAFQVLSTIYTSTYQSTDMFTPINETLKDLYNLKFGLPWFTGYSRENEILYFINLVREADAQNVFSNPNHVVLNSHINAFIESLSRAEESVRLDRSPAMTAFDKRSIAWVLATAAVLTLQYNEHVRAFLAEPRWITLTQGIVGVSLWWRLRKIAEREEKRRRLEIKIESLEEQITRKIIRIISLYKTQSRPDLEQEIFLDLNDLIKLNFNLLRRKSEVEGKILPWIDKQFDGHGGEGYKDMFLEYIRIELAQYKPRSGRLINSAMASQPPTSARADAAMSVWERAFVFGILAPIAVDILLRDWQVRQERKIDDALRDRTINLDYKLPESKINTIKQHQERIRNYLIEFMVVNTPPTDLIDALEFKDVEGSTGADDAAKKAAKDRARQEMLGDILEIIVRAKAQARSSLNTALMDYYVFLVKKQNYTSEDAKSELYRTIGGRFSIEEAFKSIPFVAPKTKVKVEDAAKRETLKEKETIPVDLPPTRPADELLVHRIQAIPDSVRAQVIAHLKSESPETDDRPVEGVAGKRTIEQQLKSSLINRVNKFIEDVEWSRRLQLSNESIKKERFTVNWDLVISVFAVAMGIGANVFAVKLGLSDSQRNLAVGGLVAIAVGYAANFVRKGKEGAASPNPAIIANQPRATNGGIDLNTSLNTQWSIKKDGLGVKMTIDPAMVEMIKSRGLADLYPEIRQITPVLNKWPLLGLTAPVANDAGLLVKN